MTDYTFTDDAKALLKQIDHAYDHQPEKLPGLAYQAIIELMKVVKENDELAAHVERLHQAWEAVKADDWDEPMEEAIKATPARLLGERP